MATPTNPSDIARETLKTLAVRKLAPTPDNYAQAYQEIGGITPPVTKTDLTSKSNQDKSSGEPAWADVIKELLRQLDIPHKGITLSNKKEGVEKVLTRFAKDAHVLHEKLHNLVRSWSSGGTTAQVPVEVLKTPTSTDGTTDGVSGASATAAGSQELLSQLRELSAQALSTFDRQE